MSEINTDQKQPQFWVYFGEYERRSRSDDVTPKVHGIARFWRTDIARLDDLWLKTGLLGQMGECANFGRIQLQHAHSEFRQTYCKNLGSQSAANTWTNTNCPKRLYVMANWQLSGNLKLTHFASGKGRPAIQRMWDCEDTARVGGLARGVDSHLRPEIKITQR